jgi:SAM-dependent methyltransferase
VEGGGQFELRSYYEAEATRRGRGALNSRRVDARHAFVDLLRSEGCRSVLDIGAGPGLDGAEFVTAGLHCVGIDLALQNCRVATESGITMVQGSTLALPVRPGSFDAGWSMSTFMHLDDRQVAEGLRELRASLRSGAPCLIGLWGGEHDAVDRSSIPGERRGFRLRSLAQNRELMGELGELEHAEVWESTEDRWPYHLFQVRTPS